MLRHLALRTKLITIAVPPLLVLGFVAGHGLLISFRGEENAAELAGDVRVMAVLALAAVLCSTLTLVLVWTSIVTPIRRVTAVADELTNKRLPRLVDSLTDPLVEVDAPIRPLDELRNDEIGQLARSVMALSEATVSVADRQKDVVSASIRELVINLARRSQTLVDRQLEYISSLEQTEQNPARLDELFRLDHLATRMRRNSESLLVLAGAEPTDRRGRSVPMADVARVAVGEIERYRQIALRDLEPAQMDTHRAVDLAHLLSELMENATQFSPPDVPAMVTGSSNLGGGYVLSVVDSGLGMTDEQLAVINQMLVNPPELGLSLTRSLGFLVVAKLAARLETSVTLAHTPGGGVTATVRVPAHMLVRHEPTPAPGLTEPTPLYIESPVAELPVSGSAGDPQPAEPVRNSDRSAIDLPARPNGFTPIEAPEETDVPAVPVAADADQAMHAGDLADAWATPAPVEPAAADRPGQSIVAPPLERSPLRADELLATLETAPEPTGDTSTSLPRRRRTEDPSSASVAGRLAPKRDDHGAQLLSRYRQQGPEDAGTSPPSSSASPTSPPASSADAMWNAYMSESSSNEGAQ